MAKVLWTKEKIQKLFETPLMVLIHQAQLIHRAHADPEEVELCTLLNIKTGGCPENCAYCPQSAHYDTGVNREALLDVEEIVQKAILAKAAGATRFCMGAAWRSPPKKDFPKVIEIIQQVKKIGLETCLTIGTLTQAQALELKDADLDYYNHNLDSSPEYYEKIITTHTYQDRLNTLHNLHHAKINVCCGGILGMGESREDRIGFLLQLVNLPEPPQSVPLNRLIPITGTPLEKQAQLNNFEFIRTVAAARIMMPTARIRLTGGRADMSEEMQALCFMAGANSIHVGEKLLITALPDQDKDLAMLKTLGLKPKTQVSTEISC